MMPIYGKTNPLELDEGIKRYGSVIGLKPEMEARYRELHANAWQSIQGRLTASNVCNYSIFIAELKGEKYLFSYFEYRGSDYEADMSLIADDPETQRWWKETGPCQIQLPNRADGESWTSIEQIFFLA